VEFNVNVSDVELFQNSEAPEGCGFGVFTGKRVGLHPYPKDNRVRGVSNRADAEDISACPFDAHVIQASMNPESHVVLPDSVELVVEDCPESLVFDVCLRPIGSLPWRGTSAS